MYLFVASLILKIDSLILEKGKKIANALYQMWMLWTAKAENVPDSASWASDDADGWSKKLSDQLIYI